MNSTSVSSLPLPVNSQSKILKWNRNIDLLLLILNSAVLSIPILYYVTKFVFAKMKFKKKHKWSDYKYILNNNHDPIERSSKVIFNSGQPTNVHINIPEERFEDHLKENRKFSFDPHEVFQIEKYYENEKTENNFSQNLHRRNFSQEIITQLFYLLLLSSYLACLLEILILKLNSSNCLLKDHTLLQLSSNIINLELITIVLITIVHFFQYGIFYGRYLWLDWNQIPKQLNRIEKSWGEGCYLLSLHFISFIYFFYSSLCNISKLIIFLIVQRSYPHKIVRLLRFYLLIIISFIQVYFTVKHLMKVYRISRRIIKINKQTIRVSSNQSSLPESEIKYRRNRSTFLSMITFLWFIPILKLGYRENLKYENLGQIPIEEQSSTQFDRFFKNYRSADLKQYPSSFLWRICWRTYRKSLIFSVFIKIFADISGLIGPISIGYILDYIRNVQEFYSKINSTNQSLGDNIFGEGNLGYIDVTVFFQNAYVIAVIVLISTFLQSTFSNNFNHLVISEAIHLKSALSCWIYHKSLTMSVNNRKGKGIDSGVIANHLAIDTTNIFQFFTMMHYLWSVPIKIAVLLCLLYKQMGPSALYGASIFFILSPFQYQCSRQISRIQKLQMNISDKRISKTNELFMGIKLLKLMGWELSFAEKVKKFRNDELKYLSREAILVAINTFITQASAILVTVVTFSLYSYLEEKPLKASTVFTSIALFNQITTPLYIVPLVIPMLISAILSHRRLVEFFSIKDIRNDTIIWEGKRFCDDDPPRSAPIQLTNTRSGHQLLDRSRSVFPMPKISYCCHIKNGKFAWYDEDLCSEDKCTLYDIQLHIPQSKLTILVGSISSGKSTLLASLIGETLLLDGEICWNQKNQIGFGYVPSTPWILNVSVRDNIIFEQVYDSDRYNEVIRACCLRADIDLLPEGDQTIIGERGIMLSGGQRQRIALARAIYSSAPTLVLDDSLSALDPIVGSLVFNNAIMKLAIELQKRTVILATHKEEFFCSADHIILIECGTIKCQGTLEQVKKFDKAFFYDCCVRKTNETREWQKFFREEGSKIFEERKLLSRSCSKRKEFRGPVNHHQFRSKMDKCGQVRRKKDFTRQISTDIPVLHFPQFNECQDIDESDQTLLWKESNRNCSFKDRHPKLERLSSTGSSHLSTHSCQENFNLDTITTLPDGSSGMKMKLQRLNSYNTSIIEEECFESLNDPLFENKKTDFNNDNESFFEDPTIETTIEELLPLKEIEQDTGTVYRLDIEPRKNYVPWKILKAYIRAHTYSRALIVFILIILNQMFRVVSDYWLANWTDKDEQRTTSNETEYKNNIGSFEFYYIKLYIILSVVSILISLITNVYAQHITIRAVKLLHDNLISTLVRCPLRFFDRTPIGRILNRFTNDINVIDKKLPIAIPVLLRFSFLCTSAIVINTVISPYFVVAILPILISYYYLQKVSRYTSRQLQRLESALKTPIFSHFNQTIDGLTTIRAFRKQKMFKDKFFNYLDKNNLCFLMLNSANCCLGIILDYFGGVILFLTMVIAITAALYWNVHRAFVGLAMTYTLLIPVYLNWMVRNLTQVEMDMNSVERIYKYSQLEKEESCKNSLKNIEQPKDWPKTGEIEFKNVSIRYGANLEPIIYDANIHIKPGEKIGICGRTGSGKSSLIGALFRINQIANGSILIDNIDITRICPNIIRKRLSIIPQDLVLFTGSIRDNLDPDGHYKNDEKLCDVLRSFRLDSLIKFLDEEEIDYEQRFSSGERQLLCCARAFLRDSPIICLDEPTSFLDPKSEKAVLEQISNSSKTVIAIAHRVLNIINFDKIAVVNDGRIVEFDTPQRLLEDKNSFFYRLYSKKFKANKKSIW